jgi:adenylate kinase
MNRRFVVVSGLPASGKSTLAQRLATALGLVLLDKDDFLERLFATSAVQNAAQRRKLSREADRIFQLDAAASDGAVLVSHWRVSGMRADSGTPIEWLADLAAPVVNLHCVCPPEIAARRFLDRARHPGHLDARHNFADVLTEFYALALLPPPIGPTIYVDTAAPPALEAVLREVEAAFPRA